MIMASTRADDANTQAVSPLSSLGATGIGGACCANAPVAQKAPPTPAARMVIQYRVTVVTMLSLSRSSNHDRDPERSHTPVLVRSDISIPVRDRHPAIFAERPVRDLDPNRRLTPLVLAAIHHRDHPRHRVPLEAHVHNLLRSPIFLYIGLQDRIHDRIGREEDRKSVG